MKTVQQVLDKQRVDYQHKGVDYVTKCFNPEHQDTNPSMRIDKHSGAFHCFSCGFKGNVYNHFSQIISFAQVQRTKIIKKIDQLLTKSVYLQIPRTAKYLTEQYRGISISTLNKFQLFRDQTQLGRILIPIRDASQNIIAFCGRAQDFGMQPKYKITPSKVKMPLFPQVSTIHNSIILVQGPFDMLNLHDKGLTNAVCCFGTQQIDKAKLNLLRMSGVSKIYIFFDGDQAGQQAAKEVKQMCQQLRIVAKNIFVKGKDPGQLSSQQISKLKEQLYE